MRRRAEGFTLLELLIAMAIGSFVLAAAVTFFILSFRQFKVQTKIVETNVEGVLGLELLRQDLETLGFGLPWNNLPVPPDYYDARAGVDPAFPANLDDAPNAPRAVVSIDCAAFTVNRSDYLVIKSVRVGMGASAGKWTTLTQANTKRNWVPAEENVADGDYVIVLRAGSTDADRRSLVTNSVTGDAYTTHNATLRFVPVEPYSANIVYGIGNTYPKRPFNRAEYYIGNAASTPPVAVPRHCAPNTGVLVKAVVAHDQAGTTETVLPLLDCVADMQVVYGLDTNGDGTRDAWEDDIRPLLATAADVRAQVVEVHVHVLTQEGQVDNAYTSAVTSFPLRSGNKGRDFDISGFRNYRWKVNSIAVKPKNLAQ
jgi:prepilin-type N-terminal cleavage/methylation domain-containing protein